MKTTKNFIAAFVMIAMTASTVFAQVKIGTNPTTIDAASNLEVEAVNNKKVIINKANGTVKIENVPPGALTDSLLTVDALGNVRLKSIESTKKVTQVNPYIRLSGTMNSSTDNPNMIAVGNNWTTNFINQMTYTPSDGIVTIQKSGMYSFALNSRGPNDLGAGTTNNDNCNYLLLNGNSFQTACGRSPRFGPTAVNTGIIPLLAGDRVTFGLTTASNVVVTSTYTFVATLHKVGELP